MPCCMVRQFHVLQFHVRHFQRAPTESISVVLWVLLRSLMPICACIERHDAAFTARPDRRLRVLYVNVLIIIIIIIDIFKVA